MIHVVAPHSSCRPAGDWHCLTSWPGVSYNQYCMVCCKSY